MNYKWYSLTIEETEKILRTNAALGLSKKAARSRVRKTGGNSFFFVESRSIGSCLRHVFCDPMFLLLIGVDIVAALFGEVTVAVSIGVILLLNMIFSYVMYFYAQRTIESMSGYSQPRVRVIRDGALYLTDSRGVVPGDILILGVGDVIPCDCRIISSNELSVKVYAGKKSNGSDIIIRPDPRAIYSPESNIEFYEYKNTLYAGSIVLSGEARAIVTEIGEHTYIGAFEGGFSLNDVKARPGAFNDVKKISSAYSFFALVVILILTVIGIFTYGSNNLLSTFLLSLSLGVSLIGEMIYVIGNIIYARSIYENATKNGKHNGGIFKSPDKIEALAKTDRLILCGTSAITDGKTRVISVCTNGQELKGSEILSTKANRAAEYFIILLNALEEYPSNGMVGVSALNRDFIDYAKNLNGTAFQDSAAIKPRTLNFESNSTVSGNIGGIENKNVISISTDPAFFQKCSKEIVNGEAVIISSERRSEISEACQKLLSVGAKLYTVTSGNYSGEILEGVFAMKSVVSEAIKEKIASLKIAGVRPIVFLDEESYDDIIIVKDSKIAEKNSEIITRSACEKTGKDICEFSDDCNAFAGFSGGERMRFIDQLKREGHTVTVYGFRHSDHDLFRLSDAKITCDRADYDDYEDFEKLEASIPSGAKNSPDGAQVLRFEADLLVKRASRNGGGVVGIYKAISTARSMHKNFVRAFLYLILSQILKITFVLPTFLAGKTLLTAFQILFATLIVDIAVVWLFSADRGEQVMMRKFRQTDLKKPVRLIKKWAIITIIAGTVTSLTAVLISFIARSNISGSAFVSVILSQLLLMYLLKDKKARINAEFIAVVAVIFVSVIALAVISKLALITGTVFSFESIICIPIAPVIIFIGKILTSRKNRGKA